MTLPSSTVFSTVHAAPHTFAAWATQDDPQPYQMFRCIKYLSSRITTALEEGGGRFIISWPPQHGKSQFISNWTPTWYLDKFPTRKVILATYSDDYAAYWGRVVRNNFERNPYMTTRLASDSTASNLWHTTAGGGMRTAGVGGGVSGFPGDLIIADDLIKSWEDAYSAAIRYKVNNWLDSVLFARRQKKSTIILNATRWHPDDPIGYVIANHPDKWTYIRLPAIAEANDPMGRAVGEPLCPELHPLEDLKSSMGNAAVWQAMYQQNPTHIGVGRVYDRFDYGHISDSFKLDPRKPFHLAFDFNVDPGMHAIGGQYDHDEDRFDIRHEIHGPRMRVRECCESAWKIMCSYGENGPMPFPELIVFGDATGSSENAQTTDSMYDVIVNFFKGKIPLKIRLPLGPTGKPHNPPVMERIDTVQDALLDTHDRRHLRVHPDCKRLIEDFQKLRTGADGMPDKKDRLLSHSSDCLGYYVVKMRPITRSAPKQQSAPNSRAGQFLYVAR